jgi:hypothetical protein
VIEVLLAIDLDEAAYQSVHENKLDLVMVLVTVQISPLKKEVALGNLSILLHEHHEA